MSEREHFHTHGGSKRLATWAHTSCGKEQTDAFEQQLLVLFSAEVSYTGGIPSVGNLAAELGCICRENRPRGAP